jgi:hypothetical protein
LESADAPSLPTIKQALDLAAAAVKRGEVALGRKRLEWVLEREPDNALAWLWMTKCVDSREEQIDCFCRVLTIDPSNRHAHEGLRRLGVHAASVAQGPAQAGGLPESQSSQKPHLGRLPTSQLPIQVGVAGQSTRRMARQRRNRAILYAAVGLGAIALLGLAIQHGSALGAGGILLLYAVLLALPRVLEKSMDRRMRRVEDAERGAKGEEAVGRILEGLGSDHLILHDVPSPFGNIDHVVIGRNAGVFLLETKAHGGRVDVIEGRLLLNRKPPDKNFIAQVLKNSYWLREEIGKVIGEEPWVTPFLVFTNAFVARVSPIKGVRIINKKFLLDAIRAESKGSPVNARLWDRRAELEARLTTGEWRHSGPS